MLALQPYVSTLGVLVLLAAWAATVAYVLWSFSAPKLVPGWRHITPGFGYWLACVMSLALSVGIGTLWLFIGSSRSDAEFQMQIAWWLAFLFGIGGAWCAYRIAAVSHAAVRWRGQNLVWKRGGTSTSRSIVGVTTVKAAMLGDRYVVAFDDGKNLSIDKAAYRAQELLDDIEDANGLADPDRPPEH